MAQQLEDTLSVTDRSIALQGCMQQTEVRVSSIVLAETHTCKLAVCLQVVYGTAAGRHIECD